MIPWGSKKNSSRNVDLNESYVIFYLDISLQLIKKKKKILDMEKIIYWIVLSRQLPVLTVSHFLLLSVVLKHFCKDLFKILIF